MLSKVNNKNSNGLIWLLSFFIFPFFTFVASLFNIRNKHARVIIFLFFLLFGWNFTINNNTGFDSIRYVNYFESVNHLTFLYDINNYISGDGDTKDIYFEVMAYLTSLFTKNYHVLFLLEALVFSAFCIGTIRIFTENACCKLSKFVWFTLALILMASNPIFNINGVRFWTASWVAVYAILYSFTIASKRPLIFLFITPLIHSSFIIIVALYFLYLLFGKFEKFWIWFAILSYPISKVSLSIVSSVADKFPMIFQKSIDHYTDPDYINQVNSGTGFTIVENFFDFLIYILIIYVAYICYRNRTRIFNKIQLEFFHMLLILISFINVTNGMPSVSSRFKWMVLPLVLYFVWINIDKQKFRAIFFCFPIVLSFKILYVLINQVSKVVPGSMLYENLLSQIFNNL